MEYAVQNRDDNVLDVTYQDIKVLFLSSFKGDTCQSSPWNNSLSLTYLTAFSVLLYSSSSC